MSIGRTSNSRLCPEGERRVTSKEDEKPTTIYSPPLSPKKGQRPGGIYEAEQGCLMSPLLIGAAAESAASCSAAPESIFRCVSLKKGRISES